MSDNTEQNSMQPTKTELKNILLSYKNKINENRLPQLAYLIIRKAIRNLQLPPGETFLEREMTEMLDMSRTPVREALVRLEMDGWIRLIPRKGFSVEPIMKESIQQICQIAEALDGVAAELATLNIDEASIKKLESLIDLQESLLYESNLKDWADVDDEFHNLIIDYSQNERLKSVMDSHSDQLYRARVYTINDRELPARSIIEHRAIVAAMKARDSKAAQTLMHSHRKRGSEEILAILERKSKNNRY
ncbi:GntR family transcriptional regulator [Lysinibacillus telephonicus]